MPRPKKSNTGNRTKLTPDLQQQICSFVISGSFFSHACMAAGVSERTGADWLQKGKRSTDDSPYRRFYLAVEQARGEDAARDSQVISKAAIGTQAKVVDGVVTQQAIPPDWRAALTKLERKHPKLWGQKIALLVDEELEKAMKKLQTGLTPEEYDKVMRLLAED